MNCFKFSICSLLFLACVTPLASWAQKDPNAKLQESQGRLLENKERLMQARRVHSTLERRMVLLKKEREKIREEKDALINSLNRLNERLRYQDEKVAMLTKQLEVQRKRVSLLIRQGWRLSPLASWRSLLTPERPDQIARQLAWLRYMVRARRQEITIYEDLQTRHANLMEQGYVDRQQQAEKTAQLNRRNKELVTLQRKTQSTQKELNGVIAALQKEQIKIKEDIESLKALLTKLQKKRPRGSDTGIGDGGFTRGSLPWPVKGKVVANFGDKRVGSNSLLWQGILIDGKDGSLVRAVHPGQVLFADRFKGWGMVAIVDHGGSFLSLYGYNDSVKKAAGEFIEAGEVLAALPMGGVTPVLYFSILRNGVPVNPSKWLTSE